MMTTHLNITKDFDARKIYENTISYAKCKSYTEIEVIDFKADKINYLWEEKTLEFIDLKTTAKLTYYNFPSKIPKQPPSVHTLEIEILGETEAKELTIRKLEIITGIKIKRSL
jgi:hypothetical protein